MNPYLNKLLLVATVAMALTIQALASNASAAGPSLGFPKGKPYYGASDQRGSQSRMRSRSMYRSTAPAIVQRERNPEAVAQAPTERRSFSYEPSQQIVSGSCGCCGTVVTEPVPATARKSTAERQSFSYEPSMNEGSAAPSRSYGPAPSSRSSRSTPWRWQSGSKAERNNYRN